MKWPDYYPADCPPPDAEPAEGMVYRFVKNDPPKRDDFLPLVVERPHKNYQGSALCKACGLSVYKDISDAKKARRNTPIFKNHMIALGELSANKGKMRNTPRHSPSHYTWWVPVGVEPFTFFQVIGE